jgi:hypothetical protein
MPVIEGQEPPPQAAQLCRCIAETDWASNFSVLVTDALQRVEFGEMGRVSYVAACAEYDDPVVPDLEEETKGNTEYMESDAATVTIIGRAVVSTWGTPPSCKEQVRACRMLPAATLV